MPTFDWQLSDAAVSGDEWGLQQWQTLAHRYATAAAAEGMDDWEAFVTDIQESVQRSPSPEGQEEIRSRLQTLVQQLRLKPAPTSPTVFVSHQRHNAGWAEWVAWYATNVNLDYWLDIHDPALTRANALILPPLVKSVLVAGIIEMALLNCTHVVSMQTVRAQASRWVSYEFGRAKERLLLATNAASWFENGVAPHSNGDYLWLGFCAFTTADLKRWLDTAGHGPPPNPNTRWRKPKPGPLPN